MDGMPTALSPTAAAQALPANQQSLDDDEINQYETSSISAPSRAATMSPRGMAEPEMGSSLTTPASPGGVGSDEGDPYASLGSMGSLGALGKHFTDEVSTRPILG